MFSMLFRAVVCSTPHVLSQTAASCQVYDDLKQQLQRLSGKQSALVAQQHACATEDSATHDSELARLRSKVAEAKVEACMNSDKLAAALETCRYHVFRFWRFGVDLICWCCVMHLAG